MSTRKPTALVEIALPLNLIAQAIIWLRSDISFSLSANYSVMSAIGPEEWWAAFWIVTALACLALTLSGRLSMRRIALSMCAALPLFVGLSFFASNPLATTAIPYLAIGVFTLCVLIEVR